MHFDPRIVPLFRRVAVPSAVRCCAVFFDRGRPCFRNSNYAILVDVIRVKSCMDNFRDPSCVPVGISINQLDLVPDRIGASFVGLIGSFSNDDGDGGDHPL